MTAEKEKGWINLYPLEGVLEAVGRKEQAVLFLLAVLGVQFIRFKSMEL